MTDPGDSSPASSNQTPAPAASRPSLFASPWLWAVLAGLILIPAMRPFLRFEPSPPPILVQLPEYTLADQQGRSFGSRELAGKVYVASFIFTRCASICPLITTWMGKLQDRYAEAGIEHVHLVSISVDPEHDTPEVLRDYAQQHGVDPERWSLLTGAPEDVRRLVVEGFKTPMGDTEGAAAEPARIDAMIDAMIDIAHSGHLVLVDPEGFVRGYYEASDLGVDEVFHRSRHVLAERRLDQ